MTEAGRKQDNATNGSMEEEANQLDKRPHMTRRTRDVEDSGEVSHTQGSHKR